jgi:hypothetical protein
VVHLGRPDGIRRVAHGLDAVPVGIEHECGVVPWVIIRPQPSPIIHPASCECGGMKGAHGRSIGRPKAEMRTARGFDGALCGDCELDAVGTRNGTVIGAAAFEVEQTHRS